MARINYYFDTEISQYKRVHTRTVDVIIDAIGIAILSMGIAMIIVVLYSFTVQSPQEMKLSHELKEMEFYYAGLNKKIESLRSVLTQIENRDDNLYRVVLGAEPVTKETRNGAVYFGDLGFSKFDLAKNLNRKIDLFREKLFVESLSQDQLIRLTLSKRNIYTSIPAIQPIANKGLLAIASGFGLRIHPVYKMLRMHSGIDFAASTGTAVYATADGQIISVDERFDGYGKMIVIDHGFGYITRYAHLQDFLVRVGQDVKRGAQIGYVGNTGLSIAPHLHYEILINGIQTNPVHYFFDDLTPTEYERVIQLASVKNQSLGN
jgi:murein DD-endopeptidase MepM/ murein hydrolase activator NlpD